jgi:hypothetical protein
MHNRKPEGLPSREIGWRDGVVLVPLVACIVALAFYPQLILHRTDASVHQRIGAVESAAPSPSVARHRGRGSEGQSISVSSGPSESGADAGLNGSGADAG